jgi:hypothetical protein
MCVSIPSDSNEIQDEVGMTLTYKNLNIEIKRTWNTKCFIISVITGATGIVTKGLKKYVETMSGKQSVSYVQNKQL